MIKPGFMGYAVVDGVTFRVNSFNFNAEQDLQFYDHTIGLRDTIPSTLDSTKGETTWSQHPQKSIFRPGVIAINGSMDATMDENNYTTLFNLAKTGNTINQLKYVYNCDTQRTFTNCRINTFTLAASAGDVIKTSATFLALDGQEIYSGGAQQIASRRLMTFDKMYIHCSNISSPIITFSLTINNAATYVYAAGTNATLDLMPKAIRMGIQDVRGTMTFYTKGSNWQHIVTNQTVQNITVAIDSVTIFKLQCIFLPIKREGAVGAVVATLPFVGVGSYWL